MRKIILTGYIVMLSVSFSSVLFAEEKPFVYDDHGYRDPFWQLVTPSGMIMNYEKNLSILDLTLEGIMAGKGNNNLAIINGQVVKKNGHIGQFLVVEINKDSVILAQDEQRFELKLIKEE